MEEFTVYAITNDVNRIYIGHTNDIEKRLQRHNGILKSKATSFTKLHKNGNWKLIYSEKYATRKEAVRREKQLKSCRGRKFIRSVIDKNTGTQLPPKADRQLVDPPAGGLVKLRVYPET